MDNPFKKQMIRMQFQEGSSKSISIGGFHLVADKTGCIEIPKDLVSAAKSHGLVEATEKVAA